VTAANTTVSPNCTRHDPADCLASRPDSIVRVRPAKFVSTRFTALPV